MQEKQINLSDKKKLVIGLSITGSCIYWALAFATLVSLKRNIDILPHKILIATDQEEEFNLFKKFENIFCCEIAKVKPRLFYASIVPKLKGNYATYWKFDLFSSLSDNEVLMYVDVDVFAVDMLNIRDIIDLFNKNQFCLAAVPSLRPVLERAAATRIRNPYDYFNAGVLFGIKDNRYQSANINAAYQEIIKFDTMSLFWHDQDIFNYMFRDDTFKLPYIYNVSTGYLLEHFRKPYCLNELCSADIEKNCKLAHISGDFLFSRKYHPYKKKFAILLESCINIIENDTRIQNAAWPNLRQSLIILQDNSVNTSVDYLLQCILVRKRIFAFRYYFNNMRLIFRKMKQFVRSSIA